MNTCIELYARLPGHSSLFCTSFGSRSKHHNHCNFHLKSESITASKSVVTTKLPGSSRTAVFVLRTKVFANAFFEHYSRTMFMRTVRISRTGLKSPRLCVRGNVGLTVKTCRAFRAERQRTVLSFGQGCNLETRCRLDKGCRLKRGCRLDNVCRLNKGLSFGQWLSFEQGVVV